VSIPGTGTGSLYTSRPTLTVTPSVINTTYGNAVPSLVGYAYGTSGYLIGAAGADAGADSLTGSLTGSTTYIQGNDIGSYNLNYASGTLASSLGYLISYANNASGISVGQRTLTTTLTGIASKNYDGNNTATLASGNYVLGNVYASDILSITNTSGTYSNKDTGTNKNVTVAGLTLSGAKAGNYTLASSSTSGTIGTIIQKALTLSGLGADNKIYNGNTTAILNGTASFSGLVGGDTVTLGGTGSGLFGDKDAANNKAVTVSGYTISGLDANNYSFTQPVGITANITQKGLTVTADNQTIIYGSTVPTGGFTYTGFITGEDASYLGTLPTLSSTLSGVQDVGTYANNYTVSGGIDTNYSFSYVSGNLRVDPRNLTVTTNTMRKNKGQPNPVFTGYNNLLSSDAALVTWDYAPIGYSDIVGTYSIGATATDPSNRLNNYSRTNDYGIFTVGSPLASAIPAQVFSSMSMTPSISTFIIVEMPIYGAAPLADGSTPTQSQWIDTTNLSDGGQFFTQNDILLTISPELKKLLGMSL